MFKMLRIPKEIESLLSEFQQFFNEYQWIHFRSLLLSLIITPYRQTISGMSKVLAFGAHRSKHNEFLIDCSHLLNKALRFYAMLLLHKLYKTGSAITIIIDDTPNKKRGKKVEAAFKFFDHVSKQYIIGQQLVCMIINYRGFLIPYCIEIYQPKEINSAKVVRKKTQIAAQMLETFSAEEGQQVNVVADTFYACSAIMKVCHKKQYIFVSALKSNRIITIDEKLQNIRDFIADSFEKEKNKKKIKINSNTYETLSRKGSLKTGGAVKLVGTRNLSHSTVKVLFTTNTALPAETIVAIYQLRWSIEVFFKESKQHLGLKTNQHRRLQANSSAITLSLIAYNLLTHVFLNQQREKGNIITDTLAKEFNVQSMQTNLRNIVTIDSLENIIELNPRLSKNKIVNVLKQYLLAS